MEPVDKDYSAAEAQQSIKPPNPKRKSSGRMQGLQNKVLFNPNPVEEEKIAEEALDIPIASPVRQESNFNPFSLATLAKKWKIKALKTKKEENRVLAAANFPTAGVDEHRREAKSYWNIIDFRNSVTVPFFDLETSDEMGAAVMRVLGDLLPTGKVEMDNYGNPRQDISTEAYLRPIHSLEVAPNGQWGMVMKRTKVKKSKRGYQNDEVTLSPKKRFLRGIRRMLAEKRRSDALSETFTWSDFFQRSEIVDIRTPALTVAQNYDFPIESDVTVVPELVLDREVIRLELKDEYNRLVNRLPSIPRELLADLDEDEASLLVTFYQLLSRARIDELHASLFQKLGEDEWSRLLLLEAVAIRYLLVGYARYADMEYVGEPYAKLAEEVFVLRSLLSSCDMFINSQEKRYQEDYELAAQSMLKCLNMDKLCGPDSWYMDVDGAIESILFMMLCAPDEMQNGRCKSFLSLWEAESQLCTRRLEIYEEAGESPEVLCQHLIAYLGHIPIYLPPINESLQKFWIVALRYFKADANYRHNTDFAPPEPSVFFLFLMERFNFYDAYGSEGGSVPAAKYPLFPEVCRQISTFYMEKSEFGQGKAYAKKELDLRLSLRPRFNNEAILDAWQRINFCFCVLNSSSMYFDFLKSMLEEYQSSNCGALLNTLLEEIGKLRSRKEVRYYERYAQQLQLCAKSFLPIRKFTEFVTLNDILVALEDESMELPPPVLSEVSQNLYKLLVINRNFAKELFKSGDYRNARDVIENTMRIPRAFADKDDKFRLESQEEFGLWDLFVDICVKLSRDMRSTSKSLPVMQLAAEYLTSCYELRPKPLDYLDGSLRDLWDESFEFPLFRQRWLEHIYVSYHWEVDVELGNVKMEALAMQVESLEETDDENRESMMAKSMVQAKNEMLIQHEAVKREVFSHHPLVLEAMSGLGVIYVKQEFYEEARVLLLECLDLASVVLDKNDPFLDQVWEKLFDVLRNTENPYEILQFIDAEVKNKSTSYKKTDNRMLALLSRSKAILLEDELVKLRYLYQIRYNEEMRNGVIPARVVALNEEYSILFEQRGALEDASRLMSNSIDILNKVSTFDNVDSHYFSVWYRLTKINRMMCENEVAEGNYKKAIPRLESCVNKRPPKLSPEDESLNHLVYDILDYHNENPETAPSALVSVVETVAFGWLFAEYLKYEEKLTAIYPFETMTYNREVIGVKLTNASSYRSRVEDFRRLVFEYPHMDFVCQMLGRYYYAVHNYENALFCARHSLHIMEVSYSANNLEAQRQWRMTKAFFLAQRRTNEDVIDFLQKEVEICEVFTMPDFPLLLQMKKELKGLRDRVAFTEKYLTAAAYYFFYTVLVCAAYLLSPNYTFWITVFNAPSVFLYFTALWLEFILLGAALFFVAWPTVPVEQRRRTAMLLERTEQLKDASLLITTHLSEEIIHATLVAALRVYEPDHIFVCDNANSATPLDDTSEVCRRLSREYHSRHGNPIDSPGIQYIWIAEGNKTVALYYTCKYHVKTKFVMTTDDDVLLPPDIYIPIQWFNETTKALCFTIQVENLKTREGKLMYITNFQDVEYKVAGFFKIFQARFGSCMSAHGAISMWEKDLFLDVLWEHNTMFNGEDLQMGIILQKMNKNYRMATVGEVSVPTEAPNHYICRHLLRCRCIEGNSLFQQRIRSWDPAAHRFLPSFMTILIWYWKRNVWILKPFVLYEMWTILQDWIRFPLAFYYIVLLPFDFFRGFGVTVVINAVLMIIFNQWVFRFRPDQKIPLPVVLLFAFYRILVLFFRFLALLYNLFHYVPFVRNKRIIKDRKNMPMPDYEFEGTADVDDPLTMRVLANERLASQWEIVEDMLSKQIKPKDDWASHWFFCVLKKCVFMENQPAVPWQVAEEGNTLQKNQVIFSDKFFYDYECMNEFVPESFHTILDAMNFMVGKSRAFSLQGERAGRMLKWLWLEYGPYQHRERLARFSHIMRLGITISEMQSLLNDVIWPVYHSLYPYLPPSHQRQVLHLQPAFNPHTNTWVLESRRLFKMFGMAPNQYPTYHSNELLDDLHLNPMLPYVILVPVEMSSSDGLRRPATSRHCLIIVHPTEKWILVRTSWGTSYSPAFVVIELLAKQEPLLDLKLYNVHQMSPSCGDGITLFWESIYLDSVRWQDENWQREGKRYVYWEKKIPDSTMDEEELAIMVKKMTRNEQEVAPEWRVPTHFQKSSPTVLDIVKQVAAVSRQGHNNLMSRIQTTNTNMHVTKNNSGAATNSQRSLQIPGLGNLAMTTTFDSQRGKTSMASQMNKVAVDPALAGDVVCDFDVDTVSNSGLWLRPLMDVLRVPILILNEKQEILDRLHCFERFSGSHVAACTSKGPLKNFMVLRRIPVSTNDEGPVHEYEFLIVKPSVPLHAVLHDYMLRLNQVKAEPAQMDDDVGDMGGFKTSDAPHFSPNVDSQKYASNVSDQSETHGLESITPREVMKRDLLDIPGQSRARRRTDQRVAIDRNPVGPSTPTRQKDNQDEEYIY